ncbi:MAG: BolA family transcriptional regulator [Candidatus Obscuribacterales bacterium]|nr:BolA family transcriptional regulator [Steroidobacteraceae bacterium]
MSVSLASRVERIRDHLSVALSPQQLDVIDDSHLHAGHAGARDGKGHYTVRIVSSRFDKLRPMARHQLVYQAVADMMHTEIHALSIVALAPNEAQ